MSFVNGVPHDPNACAIVRTIIALGKALNLRVIAEGVETRAQLDFLTDAGCNLYQGYFFGRPLSLGAFNALVNSGVVSDINLAFRPTTLRPGVIVRNDQIFHRTFHFVGNNRTHPDCLPNPG